MAQENPTGSLLAEQARRRSSRVLLSVPVIVSGTAADGSQFEEEARTLVVNAHGALISLAAMVRTNQTLKITHKMTRNTLDCTTVYIGKPQGGKAQVGIEFAAPEPFFWQIDFPPEDWTFPET